MDSPQPKYQPTAIARVLLDRAKLFWACAHGCKAVTTVMGAASVLFGIMVEQTPFILLVLAASGEYFAWRSDVIKGVAGALRRKTDAEDSFGWPISSAEISDLLVQNRSLQREFEAKAMEEPYFASLTPPGGRRALENVQESAWWTKHLARAASNYCAVAGAILLLVPLGLLLYSLQVAMDAYVLAVVGKVASSLFTLGLSLGLLRLAASYGAFSAKADWTERCVTQELGASCVDEVRAIKIMNEY